MSTDLGSTAWPELTGRRPLVAVPLGSCEQHGPHLPLDTDTRIALALARRLAESEADVVVAPPLAFGASWEHDGFPGLLSITNELLAALLVELARSATWAAGIVIVNGHGGNRAGVDAAVTRTEAEGRAALAWWPHVDDGDAHAGRTETSLLLALAPGVVRADRAEAGFTGPPREAFGEAFGEAFREGLREGLRTRSPNGVLGDPTGASAREGEAILDALAADLVASVRRWRPRLA
jgi:mycofactocin precursor peptide peptidase